MFSGNHINCLDLDSDLDLDLRMMETVKIVTGKRIVITVVFCFSQQMERQKYGTQMSGFSTSWMKMVNGKILSKLKDSYRAENVPFNLELSSIA